MSNHKNSDHHDHNHDRHDNNQHHHYDYRTITGVICAADYYQFSDLRDGALQFFPMCLKVKVVMMIGVRWILLLPD